MRGSTLRIARLRRRLRQQDVASAAGTARSRIAQIEKLDRVPATWADRYRSAIARATTASDETLNVAQQHSPSDAGPAPSGH